MPPDSPLAFNNTTDENVLSDENVAVLYKIVENAEAQSNVDRQPFRALFSAYETVLPEHGIRTAHDRIYLRFLFRLGQKKQQEESLFNGFERLLKELGIQLEFKEQDSPAQAQAELALESSEVINDPEQQRLPRRRASISTLYDDTQGNISQAKATIPPRAVSQEAPALSSRITADELRSWKPTLPEKRGPDRWNRSHGAHNAPDHMHPNRAHLARGSPNIGNNPVNFITAPNSSTLNNEDLLLRSPSDETTPSLKNYLAPVVATYIPAIYQPSRSQQLRDADTFQYHRIRAVARDVVDRWCDAALVAKQHHEHLHRLAVAQDTEVLVRQAFVHWRARLHARKSAIATEMFFDRLENRAVRARNLYLLTKALTHWAQTASDERRQKRAVRQRILAVKYFHAWHEITVENQQRQDLRMLKKHFATWKQRSIVEMSKSYRAEDFQAHHAMRKIYWHWFWKFCERRAPEWHARKLKQRYFFHLLEVSRTRRRAFREIAQQRRTREITSNFSKWSIRSISYLEDKQKAAAFLDQTAISVTLQKWSREIRYLPLQARLSNMADWRVAGDTFAIFVNRFRAQKQAGSLDDLRILRSFWTHWNDCLRQRTLTHRMDQGFLLIALYRWVLATRFSLLARLIRQRRKAGCLLQWHQSVSDRKAIYAQSSASMEARRRGFVLRHVFSAWTSQAADHYRDSQIAHEFHAPKLLVETLMKWKRQAKEKQEDNERAVDAREFFLMRRFTRLWRKRMEDSKRQRRREAYAMIRRRIKMRIASEALQSWRNETGQTRIHIHSAQSFQQDKILASGTAFFDKWRHDANLQRDKEVEASRYSHQVLLTRCMNELVSQAEHRWEFEETAVANHALHVQKTAFVCLRRLRLRLIEQRSQQGKVDVLWANHEKRRQRSLLYGWRDRTSLYQNKVSTTPALSAKPRGFRRTREPEDMGATSRAEGWTELDTNAWAPAIEAQATSTPLPGYLSTPSRRASRARAIVQSTTPTGTPFQNRLRAQFNSTPRVSRTTAFGRSRLGAAPIESVLEESPLIPGSEQEGDNE